MTGSLCSGVPYRAKPQEAVSVDGQIDGHTRAMRPQEAGSALVVDQQHAATAHEVVTVPLGQSQREHAAARAPGRAQPMRGRAGLEVLRLQRNLRNRRGADVLEETRPVRRHSG